MSLGSDKNPERVAAGLKATVHNPSVSEAAKSRARDRLSEMGVDSQSTASSVKASAGAKASEPLDSQPQFQTGAEAATGNSNQVLGGYKATLKNPRVSSEAKQHAQEILKDNEAI